MPYVWLAGLVYFGMHDQVLYALLWCIASMVGIVVFAILGYFLKAAWEIVECLVGMAAHNLDPTWIQFYAMETHDDILYQEDHPRSVS